MSRTRNFVITQWDVSWTDERYLALMKKHGIRYIAYGEEIAPKTNKPHHQMFLVFKTQKACSDTALGRLNKKLFNGQSHWEPMFGSLSQSDVYCSKAGKYHKLGDEPKQGDRNDLKDVAADILCGKRKLDDLLFEDPYYYHLYGRTLSRVEDLALRKKFRQWPTEGIWLYGDTAQGKSHMAFENYSPETHYVKSLEDEWWDGYTGQETVILNEFRGQIKFGEMLNLVDKWPHTVKRRNREPFPFLAKTVIVTSALHPREVFTKLGQSDSMDQLLRRFKVGLVSSRSVQWENRSEVLEG